MPTPLPYPLLSCGMYLIFCRLPKPMPTLWVAEQRTAARQLYSWRAAIGFIDFFMVCSLLGSSNPT